jgi:hypothetical protein
MKKIKINRALQVYGVDTKHYIIATSKKTKGIWSYAIKLNLSEDKIVPIYRGKRNKYLNRHTLHLIKVVYVIWWTLIKYPYLAITYPFRAYYYGFYNFFFNPRWMNCQRYFGIVNFILVVLGITYAIVRMVNIL